MGVCTGTACQLSHTCVRIYATDELITHVSANAVSWHGISNPFSLGYTITIKNDSANIAITSCCKWLWQRLNIEGNTFSRCTVRLFSWKQITAKGKYRKVFPWNVMPRTKSEAATWLLTWCWWLLLGSGSRRYIWSRIRHLIPYFRNPLSPLKSKTLCG